MEVLYSFLIILVTLFFIGTAIDRSGRPKWMASRETLNVQGRLVLSIAMSVGIVAGDQVAIWLSLTGPQKWIVAGLSCGMCTIAGQMILQFTKERRHGEWNERN